MQSFGRCSFSHCCFGRSYPCCSWPARVLIAAETPVQQAEAWEQAGFLCYLREDFLKTSWFSRGSNCFSAIELMATDFLNLLGYSIYSNPTLVFTFQQLVGQAFAPEHFAQFMEEILLTWSFFPISYCWLYDFSSQY